MTTVVIVIDETLPYGAQRVALELATAMSRVCECTLVTYKHPARQVDISSTGPKHHHIARRLRRFCGALEVILKLRLFVRKQSVDAVISFMEYGNVVTAVALVGTRTRHIMTQHGLISRGFASHNNARWNRLGVRLTYPRADAVVGVSDEVVRDLLEAVPALSASRTHRIYNPLNPKRLLIGSALSSPHPWLRTDRTWRSMVVVAALKPVKNQSFAIRLLSWLPVEFRLILVGDGPDRELLARQARDLGVADRLLMAGWQDDPCAWMRCADLLLVPSHHEGFGLSVLEGVSLRVPVITSRTPGLTEIASLLGVPMLDLGAIESWAEAVQKPIESRAELNPEMLKLFDPDEVANAYMRLVQKMGSGPSQDSSRTGGVDYAA
jgi:glycosyltransferase involved in cell wall biosynthesis